MVYIGRDPSGIKRLLGKIPTRCIIARKSDSDFGFAVTDSKQIKYKELIKKLKLFRYKPATYKYTRGAMSIVAAKEDGESGDVSGGIILLSIFIGEDPSELPKLPRMKKIAEVSKIKIVENEEIPNNYRPEFKEVLAEMKEDKSDDEDS